MKLVSNQVTRSTKLLPPGLNHFGKRIESNAVRFFGTQFALRNNVRTRVRDSCRAKCKGGFTTLCYDLFDFSDIVIIRIVEDNSDTAKNRILVFRLLRTQQDNFNATLIQDV